MWSIIVSLYFETLIIKKHGCQGNVCNSLYLYPLAPKELNLNNPGFQTGEEMRKPICGTCILLLRRVSIHVPQPDAPTMILFFRHEYFCKTFHDYSRVEENSVFIAPAWKPGLFKFNPFRVCCHSGLEPEPSLRARHSQSLWDYLRRDRFAKFPSLREWQAFH